MKRLIERDESNFACIIGLGVEFDDKLNSKEFMLLDAILNKLFEYEEIGLSPKDVREMYIDSYEVKL